MLPSKLIVTKRNPPNVFVVFISGGLSLRGGDYIYIYIYIYNLLTDGERLLLANLSANGSVPETV